MKWSKVRVSVNQQIFFFGLNSGLALARQVLYCLSYASSPDNSLLSGNHTATFLWGEKHLPTSYLKNDHSIFLSVFNPLVFYMHKHFCPVATTVDA
jgi:hypothetical protein